MVAITIYGKLILLKNEFMTAIKKYWKETCDLGNCVTETKVFDVQV